MNNKKVLVTSTLLLAIILLGIGTIAYFRRVVNGNITGQTGNLVLIVNEVDSAQEGSFSISLNRSESEPYVLPDDKGSFDINIDSTGSTSDVELIVSIERTNLPDNLKFYLDEKHTKELTTKTFPIQKADTMTKSLKIYWFWDGSVDDENDSLYMGETLSANISVSAQKFEYGKIMDGFAFAQMEGLEELTFTDDFSILPEECTDENFCMDISYDVNQKYPVYLYVVPTGEVNENDAPLMNAYIVSEGLIMAPSNSTAFFYLNADLKTINFNNMFSTAFVNTMIMMFAECSSLTSLDLSSFDTSNVTNMQSMFSGCSSLTSLDVSNFDTSNVINMQSMFSGCSGLTSLDVSNFDTSNVVYMSEMFINCSNLASIDFSTFNSNDTVSTNGMFSGCSSLISLDLRWLDMSQVHDRTEMFYGCSNLMTLTLGNQYVSGDTVRMFSGCSKLSTTITFDLHRGDVEEVFAGAATEEGTKITVNYTSDMSNYIDDIIATKSNNSNVVKGSLVS